MTNRNAPNGGRNKTTGRWVRTPETVAKDAEAARLHGIEGRTYQEIADHLGYSNKGTAFAAVQRGMRDAAAPARDARARREAELQLLWEEAMAILNAEHVVVSMGKVMEINGQRVTDHGSRLQAVDQLRKINESLRRLNGDDAPQRVSVDAEQLGRDIMRLLDTELDATEDDGDDTDT